MATTSTTLGGGHRRSNILEFYIEEFRPQPAPLALFRQHVIQWFFAAKTLRVFEAFKLCNNPSEEDLASHRMVCSALITFGEFATNFSKEQGKALDLESVGISVDSIAAETRLLRDNFRMFHDNTISDEQAEGVLKEAFHDS